MGFLNFLSKRRADAPVPASPFPGWQMYPTQQPSCSVQALPAEAEGYLRPDHPRLKELQERYARSKGDVMVPLLWKEGHVQPCDLRSFRGDNAYVWQVRGSNMNMPAYALAMYYIKSIDSLGLLERLEEDGCFGAVTLRIGGKTVSRDLLDSITEIYFLEKHISLSSLQNPVIMDIGAGYGRLAHRMVEAFPSIQTYLCTDAIAVSTFISEYYLRFRNIDTRAKVVPLDEVQHTMERCRVDVAVNVHSFSECRMAAIEWWLTLLAQHHVRYLMIVPNPLDHGGGLLLTNDRQDIGHAVEKHGYHLIASEPKFGDPVVQNYAIMPTCYYLFELCK
jgi:hypothetical protein